MTSNPFDAMFLQPDSLLSDKEQQLEAEHVAYEHGRVRHVLNALGLGKHLRQLTARCQAAGSEQLTFAAFNYLFSSIPFAFCCHRLRGVPVNPDDPDSRVTPSNYQVHRDQLSTEPNRYKQFLRVPFVVAYMQLLEGPMQLEAKERSVAMIFPRKGFLHGMVIHNDPSERYWDTGYAQVYKFGDDRRLYVQPLASLLTALKPDIQVQG